MRFDHGLQRPYTPKELWFSHGWPIIDGFKGFRTMDFDTSQLSSTQMLRLVGNGMHLPTVATFIFSVLS